MRSQAADHGKKSSRCVPEGASDGKNTGSRQHIACMYSNTANLGKICVACIQKAPQSAVGEYTARTSCHQGALSPSEALRSCTAHESCHPPVALPLRRVSYPSNRIAGSPFNGLALAQGCLPPPSEPQRRTPLGISLKEGEMRAAPRFNKCSTQCAVDYRIRIGFEYQSVPLLE